MADLSVIDLGSQAEAVARFVSGWTKSEFLAWLSQFGEVVSVLRDGDEDRYSFRSSAGIWTGFWFTPQGELKLLGSRSGITRIVSVPMRGD